MRGLRMGLLVSAMMALATTEDATVRAAHHGRLAEGWARSQFVGSDMNWDQVNAVLGQRPDLVVSGIGGYAICDYSRLGVTVVWEPGGKTIAGWEYRPFRR